MSDKKEKRYTRDGKPINSFADYDMSDLFKGGSVSEEDSKSKDKKKPKYEDGGIVSKEDVKRAALKGLRHKMSEMGGDSLKAVVSAKDPKSLKAGLEKASEIVENKEEEIEEHMEMDDKPDLDAMDADELRSYIKENY